LDYIKLGNTGLDISPLALGCMSYGEPAAGSHEWTLPEDESRLFIRKAIELGINFFDTANSYSGGTGEEILGRALKDYARRDEVVVATKVYQQVHDGPNGRGLSRKAIFQEIDKSLRRLGTDYVDLYIIHRYDDSTPLVETLEALNDVVRAGKALYLGASSMYAWQFAKCLNLQQMNGWARFVSMQNHYNLLNREEEREMIPLCADQSIAVTPWSPLARGKLTRPWDSTSKRSETDLYGKNLYSQTEESDRLVVSAVEEIAKERGVPQAQIALAWVQANAAVAAPIVGATKMRHLEDAVASQGVKLSADEVARLELGYVPHPAGIF
jgi:aryl-alcohol dehydrogenase-like predicted oxidoreductase